VIKTITGFRAEAVRLRILAGIFFSALSHLSDTLKVLSALSEIRAKRRAVHGAGKIKKFIKADGRYFFMDNIPGWPSVASRGYFRTEIARAMQHDGENNPLSTVFFSITSKCPLRCRHCYERDNLSVNEYLSLENLKQIVANLKDYGVFHFQLSGGEPLERFDDLISIVECTGKGADVWINTSGYGLTYERALSLKKAGLTGAEISLDHWDEDEHNLFRDNAKSFSWARDAAMNCRKAGIITCLSLCATNKFITGDNLKRYASLAMEWGVSFIRLLEPRETKTFKGNDVLLSADKIKVLEEFFLNSTSGERLPEYPIVSYPGYHQRRVGCLGAGNHYLYIDTRGDIHACPFCRSAAGNAVTDRIEDVVKLLRKRGCQAYTTAGLACSINNHI